jgi:hypothetical protein
MKDVSELFKTSNNNCKYSMKAAPIFDEGRCQMAAPVKLPAESIESARVKYRRAVKGCRRRAAGARQKSVAGRTNSRDSL